MTLGRLALAPPERQRGWMLIVGLHPGRVVTVASLEVRGADVLVTCARRGDVLRLPRDREVSAGWAPEGDPRDPTAWTCFAGRVERAGPGRWRARLGGRDCESRWASELWQELEYEYAAPAGAIKEEAR